MTEFDELDKNGNGSLEKDEFRALDIENRKLQIQDADEKRNTERLLVKACAAGMLLYPFIILHASFFVFDTAASLITDISTVYSLAASTVVVGYFGFNTLKDRQQ